MPLLTLSSVAQVRLLSCGESTPASTPLAPPVVIVVSLLPLLLSTIRRFKRMYAGVVTLIRSTDPPSMSGNASGVAVRVTSPFRSAMVACWT